MSKLITQYKVLFCGAFLCFLGGFYICTISTRTVFIGLAVIGIGMAFALSALSPVKKMILMQREEKENRIRRLEEAVELLKQNHRG